MKRGIVLGLLGSLLGPLATAAAQTPVPGGIQNVGAWNEACGTTRTFVNNTGLRIAGLWVGINNDNMPNLTEIGTVVVDQVPPVNWDVDDDENQNNTGELGDDDSTPTSSLGWHRAQAVLNADIIDVGENFTVRLCDSAGNPIGGRTVFIIPMAPIPGPIGGDSARRTELPFGVKSSAPLGSVTIDTTGQVPFSDRFAVNVTNTDPTLSLKQLKIIPPSGMVENASASGGGTYNSSLEAIVWSTPVPPNGSSQVIVDLSTLLRPLTSTTIQFDAILFVSPPGVPALPRWGLIAAATALALFGASRARRMLA